MHPSVQGDKVKELFGDDVDTVYVSDPSLGPDCLVMSRVMRRDGSQHRQPCVG